MSDDHAMMDEGMAMPGMHDHAMLGMLGPYPMTREASGTAWQPDDASHRGIHAMRGAWALMLHGMADVVADHQSGPRGADKLEPEVDQDRTTVSAMYDGSWPGGRFETTIAWGRDLDRPGNTLDAFAAEAAVETAGKHTVFVRAERVHKDDLVLPPAAGSPFVNAVVLVGELTGGYRYDFWRSAHVSSGIGVLGSLAFVPHELQDAYGPTPGGVSVFARVGLE
jgi:hypothetical protein